MTNIDISGIINKLLVCISSKGKIKILMEANADCLNTSNLPHGGHIDACLNKMNMENMKIDLTKATNYLVQLFYKTNLRYTCTRTKIGKLLSIVAFVYARQDKLLFEETIHKYDQCGTAIYEIMERFKDSDIYTRIVYEDCENRVPDVVMANAVISKVTIPDEYEDIVGLDVDVISTIDSVFQMFGAYSPSALGECINPIVNYQDVTNPEGEVVLSNISKLQIGFFAGENNCHLINYLFEH